MNSSCGQHGRERCACPRPDKATHEAWTRPAAGQWEALQEACAEEEACLAESGLQVVHGFVDHAMWMQQCSLVVHHGGMGTLLATLGAGLPAVACPLHFDQHQNV